MKSLLEYSLNHVNPAIVKFGFLEVRWYGVMYFLAFLLAAYLFNRFAKEKLIDLTRKEVDYLINYLLIGLIIGARTFYCLIYDPYFWDDPLSILRIWEGGLSFHGALIGLIFAAYLFSRKYKKKFINVIDVGAIAGTPGLFLGRVGNFLNGELFGRETTSSWGIVFPLGGDLPRYPSQLIEGVFEGIFLFLLLYIWRKNLIKREGMAFSLFLMGYATVRFLIEFIRQPDPQIGFIFHYFTMGQLLSVLMFIAALLFQYYLLKKRKNH